MADDALASEPEPANRRDLEAFEAITCEGQGAFNSHDLKVRSVFLKPQIQIGTHWALEEKPRGFTCIMAVQNYTGAVGIHDTLITGSAQNTIIEYDA